VLTDEFGIDAVTFIISNKSKYYY